MNTDIQNKTTAPEATSPQPTTNEEILSLLHKLVEQNETDKTNDSRCHGLPSNSARSTNKYPLHIPLTEKRDPFLSQKYVFSFTISIRLRIPRTSLCHFSQIYYDIPTH